MGLVRKLIAVAGSDLAGVPSDGKGPAWDEPYETLRKRWDVVPTASCVFESSNKLMALSDDALLVEWEKARLDITAGTEFSHRGWYHALYADGMCGKKVMDLGSGF